MGTFKKGVVQSDTPEIDALHSALSKAALMDIVIDLVRRNAGDEMLDGVDLAQAIVTEGTPVLIARGDEPPFVTLIPRCAKCSKKACMTRRNLCVGCFYADSGALP